MKIIVYAIGVACQMQEQSDRAPLTNAWIRLCTPGMGVNLQGESPCK
jgi:hypothetical protein